MCTAGAACQFSPKFVADKPVKFGEFNEFLCSFWHNDVDRRRELCDQNQMFVYRPTMCKQKRNCRIGLQCGYSHNHYESYFHPSKYKRGRCNKPEDCKFGRFCPFFHTEDERENWKKLLDEIFTMPSEEVNTEGGEWAEDNFDPYEPGPHKRPFAAAGIPEYGPPHHPPPHQPAHPPPGHLPHFGGGTGSGMGSGPGPSGMVEENKMQEQTVIQEHKEKLTKNVHSTLIVRKKFENVKLFSEFLKKQTVHTMYPLVVNSFLEGA